MPLKSGSSKATMDENFHEFRHGKTFAKTASKYGKADAEKQLQAVVLSKAREGRKSGAKK
jgi:hypothetical protein